MENKLAIVDLNTGELKRELKNDDRVTTKKQRDIYKNKMNVRYEGKFVNSMDQNLKVVSDKLTLSQLGLFASLFRFMDFNNKKLKYNGENLTKATISQVLKLNYHTTNKQLKALVDNELLIVNKSGNRNEYEINDEFVFIGKFLKKDFSTKIFTIKLAEMTEGMKLNEIGLFYRLLPYLNTSLYILCYNPYEINTENIVPLQTFTEIAKISNVDRSHISKIMNRLKRKNLIVSVSGRKTIFVVNPEIASRDPEKVTFDKVLDVVKNEYNRD